MKLSLLFVLVATLVFTSRAQEYEEEEDKKEEEGLSWWSQFKRQVKTVLRRWRDDLKMLWDQTMAKAADMRTWTVDMFENFKLKLREWLESKPDVPDDEKNEIETFISKLKLPTEKPKEFDP